MAPWRAILYGVFFFIGMAWATATAERERSVHSPLHTVALLELYTSEG